MILAIILEWIKTRIIHQIILRRKLLLFLGEKSKGRKRKLKNKNYSHLGTDFEVVSVNLWFCWLSNWVVGFLHYGDASFVWIWYRRGLTTTLIFPHDCLRLSWIPTREQSWRQQMRIGFLEYGTKLIGTSSVSNWEFKNVTFIRRWHKWRNYLNALYWERWQKKYQSFRWFFPTSSRKKMKHETVCVKTKWSVNNVYNAGQKGNC